MKLVVFILTSRSWVMSLEPSAGSLQGSIFFQSLHSSELVRLDACGDDGCASPVTIATGLSTYGGLLPWHGSLLAALKRNLVVQIDPWRQDSSSPMTTLVDVERALGPGDHGSFSLGGTAWCDDSLFIVFGGQSGASGVMRCTNCSMGHDCTKGCAVVDGGAGPGPGLQQLSGFAAGIACADNNVLVTDNANFRVQTFPAGCTSAPCDVQTFIGGLKWPLGIAVVRDGKRVLVTLDEGIVSIGSDGVLQREHWSSLGDTGFLCEGEGRILVSSGSDGNVVSFDPACVGPNCTATVVWNSTGSSAKAAGAIAYMPRPRQEPVDFLV